MDSLLSHISKVLTSSCLGFSGSGAVSSSTSTSSSTSSGVSSTSSLRHNGPTGGAASSIMAFLGVSPASLGWVTGGSGIGNVGGTGSGAASGVTGTGGSCSGVGDAHATSIAAMFASHSTYHQQHQAWGLAGACIAGVGASRAGWLGHYPRLTAASPAEGLLSVICAPPEASTEALIVALALKSLGEFEFEGKLVTNTLFILFYLSLFSLSIYAFLSYFLSNSENIIFSKI
ncbi:unnamed protein product [Protopolystoma xenopodis]|uniref:Uncharacterized protein n=1 Tax=Protopolystoma xenopodis TaxID=117903 RepID=A0A3S5A3P3_9PLAT|nr:unnamed protein product [Protopolystoma xenopodis]